MSKLKIDTQSLTQSMQNNPDFIPTLVSALTASQQQGAALAPTEDAVALDDALVSDDDYNLKTNNAPMDPSDMRAAIEQDRHDAMIANALS